MDKDQKEEEIISIDSDDSDVSVASSEEKEVMIKIEPEDDYDELPEIEHSTVSGSLSSFDPSLVGNSSIAPSCGSSSSFAPSLGGNSSIAPSRGSSSSIAPAIGGTEDPTARELKEDANGNSHFMAYQDPGSGGLSRNVTHPSSSYQDPTSATFGGGLSRNVTHASSRANMFPGLGLGSEEDWAQHNYGQMNNRGGHMDSGRNVHKMPLQELPFSPRDPMMNQAQQLGITRIATHNAGTGPRMSRMGSGGSAGIARLINTPARERVESNFVILRSSAFTQDKVDSGDVQRIVGFKAGDRIGNLVMEPRHVLVEKFFREGSEARAYHAAASKDWHWDGYRITAELSDKTSIKTADGEEPRKKYSRRKF